MKEKRAFCEFIREVYNIDICSYDELPEMQKKAIEIDYINRYGAPIRWF